MTPEEKIAIAAICALISLLCVIALIDPVIMTVLLKGFSN